jgi:endoglucanase
MLVKLLKSKSFWFLSSLTAIAALLVSSFPFSTVAQILSPHPAMIVVNQVGYLPEQSKIALLLNDSVADATAQLVDQQTKAVVFSKSLGQAQFDSASGDVIQSIDFSAVQQAGEYHWQIGNLRSVPFKIAAQVYQEAFAMLLRSYYLQRCGVELNDPVTGIYHPPCHVNDAVLAHQDSIHLAGESIAAQGGWHDAGDYGKYVATTAVTLGRILSLYEQQPHLFWDGQLVIPESGNGIPDVLDEMQVGLDWLLRMQRQDGAVYRKLSGADWSIGLSPDEDQQLRYVYGLSTPETAKFAAAMAIAARVFHPLKTELAQQYQQAAEKAWRYLEQHPTMQVDWIKEDDSGSGKYLSSEIDTEPSLMVDTDDRFWAAAELYITTGQLPFEQYVSNYLKTSEYTLFEWKDPSALGMTNYLFQTRQPIAPDIRTQLVSKLQKRADQALAKANQSGYRLANDRFIWGSNKIAAEEAITLLYAHQATPCAAYQTAAADQLDYLLGRNPFNQTFVTGLGTHPVQHTNHLFARAKGVYIPGLLVGGANELAQDQIAPKKLGIRSYLDDDRSYATNEYAIDYNASLITLLGLIQSNHSSNSS